MGMKVPTPTESQSNPESPYFVPRKKETNKQTSTDTPTKFPISSLALNPPNPPKATYQNRPFWPIDPQSNPP
ncbi:hypothetical protein BDW42DRAFT_158431 [Aspergillus taichungensis]|uniref:Uncharacterized protein n=1 Tax=Aspergillus taichungensis TaxID=482145 RepID=A0A2J5I9J4_9EURO|nr:hypothetical protein BDW42DRAFT_158431 [Aspergillus taichungensis]